MLLELKEVRNVLSIKELREKKTARGRQREKQYILELENKITHFKEGIDIMSYKI